MKNQTILFPILVVLLINLLPIKSLSQETVEKPIFIDLVMLDKIRGEFASNDSLLKDRHAKITKSANALLNMRPLSVVDKSFVPPSGDKHDFVSMGPYWWPDPSKKDGLPYIRRDGERNPEYRSITDESYLNKTISAVESLAVAYYLTKDSNYSAKAADLLRVWFINNDTKMNPNMNHAQYIPGINTGRGIGLIETRYLYKITDAVVLLRSSNEWSKNNDQEIVKWFGNYFTWITSHKYGVDESNEENNHGTWYDVQKTAIAIFLGKKELAAKTLEEVKLKRIAAQIETDGKQPLELARTRSWNYSIMNLSAFMHLAVVGERVGIDLWNYKTPSGGSIRKALDYLLPYALDNKRWEYKQISKWENDSLIPLLQLARKKYDNKIYGDWIKKIFPAKVKEDELGRII